jgi:hypothetical protein
VANVIHTLRQAPLIANSSVSSPNRTKEVIVECDLEILYRLIVTIRVSKDEILGSSVMNRGGSLGNGFRITVIEAPGQRLVVGVYTMASGERMLDAVLESLEPGSVGVLCMLTDFGIVPSFIEDA